MRDKSEEYNLENHRAQKRVMISVNPAEGKNIMSTVGYDKVLYTWHTSKNMLLAKKVLNRNELPTCLKWSIDGKMLLVGFSDGHIYIYNLEENAFNQKTKGLDNPDNDIFSDLQELKNNDARTAVLSIEFSDSGDYMAVSFDNKKVPVC